MMRTVAAIIAVAALITILLAVHNASAAVPSKPKHSKVTVIRHRKPIYVKMVGDRRAAENFAEQAYADLLARNQRAAAERKAEADRVAAAQAAQQAAASNNNYAAVPQMQVITPGVVADPYTNSIYIGGNSFAPNLYTGYGALPGYPGYGYLPGANTYNAFGYSAPLVMPNTSGFMITGGSNVIPGSAYPTMPIGYWSNGY